MKNNYKLSIAALFAFGLFQAQDYRPVVEKFLNSNANFKNINSEKKQFVIDVQDESKSLNGTVLQILQTYNGVPIYGSVASALVKNDEITYFTDNFSKLSLSATAKNAKIDRKSVFSKVVSQLGIQNVSVENPADKVTVKDVYFPQDTGLVPAYKYEIIDKNSSDVWEIVADASTGEILSKVNLTVSCAFEKGAFGREHSHAFVGPTNITQEHSSAIMAPDAASYNVYALPVEAPSFGPRKIVTNPWDLTASPEGWHSDGVNHYTYTRGNNVFAYTDLNSTNTVGAFADGGANRNFDFPLDLTQHHSTYQNAAVTNLFYVSNMTHDIMYRFGFTEAARNFQNNNFGKGGIGGDEVAAQARDGIDNATPNLDNANFSTPSDGTSGRMQMYMWSPATPPQIVFYNSPTNFVDRKPKATKASFGPALTATGVTADIATTTPTDGCTDITEDLTGKFALIQRGTCSFTIKVKNAQLKGALGAIIYNAPTSAVIGTMGGTDATITIPSVLIENAEGEAVKNQLASTPVNATLKDDKSKYIYVDGDLDNGIIVHEYGHGVSTRMTGTGSSGLSYNFDNEQMGEGWSDFFALMLTNQPGDNASVARGVGNFATSQPNNGRGIRPAKYSPDFAINNYTYGKTNGMFYVNAAGSTVPDVHSIGFIWATMLWDLHWKYVEKYGYASNVAANPTSGSARVLQLVMDGIKLQGNFPSFAKGRDAILAADQATTGGADKCMIWGVFAKRGLGVKASPGLIKPATSSAADVAAALNDQVEDFTIPADCAVLATNEVKGSSNGITIYPNPAKNEIRIKSATPISGKLLVTIYDASGKLVTKKKVENAEAINVSALPNGVYIIKGEGVSVNFNEKFIINK